MHNKCELILKQKRKFLFVFTLPKLNKSLNGLRVCITFAYVLNTSSVKTRLRKVLGSV